MTQGRKVHIVGAGMAGLAAAVRSVELGLQVRLSEGAPQAGGRCRSFEDSVLGRIIDNGNHLILGANPAIFAYLGAIGAADKLTPLESACFPFLDVSSGAAWTVRPGAGRWPWWLLDPDRRVPGARLADYWAMLRILNAPASARLDEYVNVQAPMFARFWEPLALAVLNTEAAASSARLLGRVLAETLMRGGAASRPYFAHAGLGSALVDPALAFLERSSVATRFSCRLRGMDVNDDRVTRLIFDDEVIEIGADETVILAVPSWEAGALIPGLVVPTETRPIVNAHFQIESAFDFADGAPFLGVIGGTAHWLFRRGDVVSATVSAARVLADDVALQVAEAIWRDVAAAIGRPGSPLPRHRIIKEKRATIAQTPGQDALRPPTATRWRNLLLAGDWTQTGLPATIEGAVGSGRHAAELAGNLAK